MISWADDFLSAKLNSSIISFFFIYILLFILSSVILSLLGLDFLTALSASASAISNVGPGVGERAVKIDDAF